MSTSVVYLVVVHPQDLDSEEDLRNTEYAAFAEPSYHAFADEGDARTYADHLTGLAVDICVLPVISHDPAGVPS